MAVQYRCPICKKPLPERGDWFPFCSDRCKTQDLGAWASGNYAIPGEEARTEQSDSEEDTESSPGPNKKRSDAA